MFNNLSSEITTAFDWRDSKWWCWTPIYSGLQNIKINDFDQKLRPEWPKSNYIYVYLNLTELCKYLYSVCLQRNLFCCCIFTLVTWMYQSILLHFTVSQSSCTFLKKNRLFSIKKIMEIFIKKDIYSNI